MSSPVPVTVMPSKPKRVAPRSSSSQRAALRARREALRALPGHVYEKHWVGPAWLEDCLDAGECRPPEARHRVDLS